MGEVVESINLGYLVSGLLVPAIVAIFTLYSKTAAKITDIQTERLADIREMMQQNHDALRIIEKVSDSVKGAAVDTKEIHRMVSEFIMKASTQHDAMIANQKRIEETLSSRGNSVR